MIICCRFSRFFLVPVDMVDVFATSATCSGFFMNNLTLFFHGLFRLLFSGLLFGLFHIFFLLFGANCAFLGSASATGCWGLSLLFGAAGTGFGPSAAAAACVGAGQRDAAHADQAGHA